MVVQTEVMTGGYLRVAGVLSGIGGRVMLHGGSQDMDMASSSQWPVMSVTSWAGPSEVVDERGKGVMSVPVSLLVVVESSGMEDPEELASVFEAGLGLLEIVLTRVVKTSVLSELPDASETFIAVIVLTNVVTTLALDELPGVLETVVEVVTLAEVADSEAVEAVKLPLLLLPTDAVMPAVILP
jgi:hypothetical protein